MFTGIISELGTITDIVERGDSVVVTVQAPGAVSDASHGESIAVSGVCLTVMDMHDGCFTADVMGQTLAVTNSAQWVAGRSVNIESAMSVGDKLGGHIVQGHIDDTATVMHVTDHEPWRVIRFSLGADHAPLVVDKGSIAVDGVSLTVSAVGRDWFEVSLIPETLVATTLGRLTVGDHVNIETDILARHVARLNSFTSGATA
ncbi:riboflavin synthase alpha chain [Microbacteriaceae bacterium MWH-Ta3]|nr:riboflavin synthase alpha chain [Microbacteriaceae bacterium MWH-Ta3]